MNDFLDLFSEEECTETIKKLVQKSLKEKMWISEGMELTASRKDDLKYWLSEDPKVLEQYENRFLIFGQATHSGSAYAFYKTPGAKNCDEWPVLVLGDEGGTVILANNIFGLMRFWTLNSVQPYVSTFDYSSFDLFADDGEYEDGGNEAYKAWIQAEFGIAPLKGIEAAKREIINPAIKKYQEEIDLIFDD